MFVFLRRHANNTWLSLLGATVYAFSPGMVWRATQVHLNTLAVWWIPLALLLWDLALERRSVRWSLVLGGCIYLAFMNYSELVLWILLTLSPYMLYGLLIQPTWHARWQVIGLGCVAALAAFLPTLVTPLPQLQLLRKRNTLGRYPQCGTFHFLLRPYSRARSSRKYAWANFAH
jgi:hypothetical protein